MGYIDTHAHLWSEAYLNRLAELGSPGTKVASGIKAGDTDKELAARFKMMDEAGVSLQVISATPQSPQWGTEEEAVDSAHMINDLYRTLVQQYPDLTVFLHMAPFLFLM